MLLLRVGCAAIGVQVRWRCVEAASVLWEADSEEWQGLAARPST